MGKNFINTNIKMPPGLRRNNPGNLRPLGARDKWEGQISVQNNFSVFIDVSWGIRAMATNIVGLIIKYKVDTIRKLITKYAPPSENNTAHYIKVVAQQTGLNADKRIIQHPGILKNIMRAMINMEIGPSYSALIEDSDIYEGINNMSGKTVEWLKGKL